MADSKLSLEADASASILREAKRIIRSQELVIPPLLKNSLEGQFYEFLKLSALLGNYAIVYSVVGVCLVSIAVLLLSILIPSAPVWAYVLYAVAGLAIICGLGVLGSYKVRYTRSRSRRQMVAYSIRMLSQWTKAKLEEERQLNNRRFLLESLLNSLFDYTKFDPDGPAAMIEVQEVVAGIVNDSKNFDIIFLICHLFDLIFRGAAARYDERGVLVLIKILAPILNHASNDQVSNLVHGIIKDFVHQTKINIYTCRLNIVSLDPHEKITLRRKTIGSYKVEVELFQDIWRVPLEIRLNTALDARQRSALLEDRSVSFINRNIEIQNYAITAQPHKLNVFADDKEMGFGPEGVIIPLDDDGQMEEPGYLAQTTFERGHHGSRLSACDKSHILITQPNDKGEEDCSKVNDATPEAIRQHHFALSQKEPQCEAQTKQPKKLSAVPSHRISRIQKIELNEPLEESSVMLDDAVIALLSIEAEPESNYKVMIKNSKMTILRKTEENNPIVLIKSTSIVDGSADKIFTLIYDLNYRSKWDKVFSNLKIVKILNQNIDIMYSYLKAPMIITDRDFLQKRACYKNYKGIDYLIAFRSWEDPDVPPLKNVIRANTIISGYVIRALGPAQCSLTIVSQTDIKGYIPKSMINAAAAKSPLDWIKRLETALNLFQ